MSTRGKKLTCVSVLAMLVAVLHTASAPSQQLDKKQDKTAVAIAKDWRYPQVKTVELGIQPRASEAFCFEQYTVQAQFADVWNHYAAQCGLTDKFRENFRHAVMSELKGSEKGHFMVLDVVPGRETHFGQNTAQRTLHVTIRKGDEKATEVSVLAAVR